MLEFNFLNLQIIFKCVAGLGLGVKNPNPMGVGVSVVLPPEQPLGLGLSDDFECGFGKCQTRTHGRPLPSLVFNLNHFLKCSRNL